MNYEWVTPEMFNEKLEELVGKMHAGELLAIPGLAETLREELNNQVLGELELENPDKVHPQPTTEKPDEETLHRWITDGNAEATDGCHVGPGSTCEHGYPSWLMALGILNKGGFF